MDTKDAIVGLLVGAMVQDGRVLRTEFHAASLHLEALEEFGITASDLRTRFERLSLEIANSSRDAFVDRCASAIPWDVRDSVLRAVIAVVESDDDVEDNEFEYVEALARRMGIALRP